MQGSVQRYFDAAIWQLAMAAYVEVGRFPEAVQAADDALTRARRFGWDLGELEAHRLADGEGRVVIRASMVLSTISAEAEMAGSVRACEESPSFGTRITRCD